MQSLIYTVLIIVVIYSIIFTFFYIYQGKLIFFPPKPNPLRYQKWKNFEIRIRSGSDELQGWNLTNNQCSNNYTLLYFGGNAEDVSANLADAENYNVKNLYFINLSGYGNSTGKPSQRVFYANSLDVYDYLLSDEKVDPGSIILMGRSLGSAVAIYLNAKKSVKALILITPFDKLANLVPGFLKMLLPTRYLLRHKFDNLRYLSAIKNEILILAASNDEIIPADLTMALHDACNGNSLCSVIEDANHNFESNDVYFEEINDFISELT